MIDFMDYLNKLLDYIYRKKCYFCGSSKECVKMCSKCYDELQFCDSKENRYIKNIKVFSAGIYEKNLQKMIRGLKYHRQKDLAYYMAKFMWEYFSDVAETYGMPASFQVVPVPLHKSRQRKRGYNHMELVAKEFCRLSGYTLNTDLIKRIKATKPQYKLSFYEKQNNLKNAFKADESKILDLPILIIDDICTSGSTFNSMIEEMNTKGINNITCLAASSPQ